MADRRLAVISSHVAGGGGGGTRRAAPFCARELNKALLEPHGHYEVRQAILEFLKVRVWLSVGGAGQNAWTAEARRPAPAFALGAALDAPFCRAGARSSLPPPPFLRALVSGDCG